MRRQLRDYIKTSGPCRGGPPSPVDKELESSGGFEAGLEITCVTFASPKLWLFDSRIIFAAHRDVKARTYGVGRMVACPAVLRQKRSIGALSAVAKKLGTLVCLVRLSGCSVCSVSALTDAENVTVASTRGNHVPTFESFGSTPKKVPAAASAGDVNR